MFPSCVREKNGREEEGLLDNDHCPLNCWQGRTKESEGVIQLRIVTTQIIGGPEGKRLEREKENKLFIVGSYQSREGCRTKKKRLGGHRHQFHAISMSIRT